MQHTPKDEIVGTLAAMGPLSFKALAAGVLDQCTGVKHYYQAESLTVEAINALSKAGTIKLYDTGDAWDIA